MMNETIHAPRLLTSTTSTGICTVRLATTQAEIHAAQALRFNVFNLELNEGLESSYATRTDVDEFDAVCDHHLVEHVATGEIVGTYRMQTGEAAAGAQDAAIRTSKNSSRFELEMQKNLSRSSNGFRESKASSSTRWLNSSQLSSRFRNSLGFFDVVEAAMRDGQDDGATHRLKVTSL